jgi:hypothetical protein
LEGLFWTPEKGLVEKWGCFLGWQMGVKLVILVWGLFWAFL